MFGTRFPRALSLRTRLGADLSNWLLFEFVLDEPDPHELQQLDDLKLLHAPWRIHTDHLAHA